MWFQGHSIWEKTLGMRAYSNGIACEQDQDDQQEAHHLIPGFAECSTDDLQPGVMVQQVPQLNSCEQNQEGHEVNDCWVYFYCLIEADEPVPRKADSYSAGVCHPFLQCFPCSSIAALWVLLGQILVDARTLLSSVASSTCGCESIGQRPCIWLGDLKKPWNTTPSRLLKIHPANQGQPPLLLWFELNAQSQKERS